MEKQKLRVVVASEHPEVRYFLRGMVEREGQAVIVGQAENAVKALTLVRNLRPDVALIDCYLPHAVGLDSVALSRMGGLDTAQNISEEIPNTKVVLLRNLDAKDLSENSLAASDVAFLSKGLEGVDLPFTLHERREWAPSHGSLVFVDVEIKPQVAEQQKVKLSYKTVLFAILGTLGVLFLIFAVTFGGGIFLALAGVAAMFVGLAVKLTSSWLAKRKGSANELATK
ncbi:MAG: hypothetical protein HY663_00750 [Chloroflexi bacterium]|nr:hypothetical protein [Chloroflexota bacterium]